MKLIKKMFAGPKNKNSLTGKDIGIKAGQTVIRQEVENQDASAVRGKNGTLIRKGDEVSGQVRGQIDWNIGDIILDLYEVTGFLGEGGMGKVYKVQHLEWGIELAVKIPQPGNGMSLESGGGDDIYSRFVTEAETWVNLGLHPHVVSCYYVRRLEGFPGVFAEYVDGGSLAESIYKKGLYRGEESEVLIRVLDIAIQFSWGLQYAHEQGLVHQDVKPANVMLTSEGVVKVTDFGLAKAAASAYGRKKSLTGENILVSVGGMTEAYCSPEQAMGGMLNHKTDMWSWGVSILEMFTGTVTWDSGPTALDALEQYVAKGPQSARIPKMPATLVSLLRQCFKYDPVERPHSMADISEGLKQVYRQVAGSDYPRMLPPAGRDTADSLNNRAVSLMDLHLPTQAENTWESALNAQPHHPEATYNRNLILWRSRKLKEDRILENALMDVIKSHGENGYTQLLMAMTYLEIGNCPAALQYLGKISGDEVDEKRVKSLLATAKAKLPYSLGPVRVFQGHSAAVKAVALSVDNRWALTASEDTLLKLWDVQKGTCLKTFKGHTRDVSTISLSKDGKLAVSGSSDRTLKLWDIGGNIPIRTFSGHNEAVKRVFLSGDGKHILSNDIEGTVKIWDAQTGQCLQTFTRLTVGGNIVSVPPGWRLDTAGVNLLTVVNPQGIMLLDINKGTPFRSFKTSDFKPRYFCMSDGGRYGISADQDRNVRIWDMNSGQLIRTLTGHENEVQAVALSNDRKYVISGSFDRTLKLWEVSSGVQIRTFSGHTNEVTSVCFSRDGQYALSGSADYTARLWRVKYFPFFRAPMMLSRISETQEVISAQEQFEQALNLAIRSLAQNEPASALPHLRRARSFRGFERDSHALDTWTSLYISIPKKSFSGAWEVTSLQGHEGAVYSVCLSNCNSYALTGGADNTLKLWDTRTSSLIRTFSGHKKAVTTVVLSEDGKYAFSGSRDGTIKQWSVFSGALLRSIPGESVTVNCLAISGDSRFIMGGGSNTPHLWDAATGYQLRTFKQHPMLVNTVALSGDGQYALSGSNGYNDTLKMWKVSSGQCIQTFSGHEGYVAAAAFSRDGKYVLAAGGTDVRIPDPDDFEDQDMLNIVNRVVSSTPGQKTGVATSIKLWDAGSGELISSFVGHEKAIFTLDISWDGKYAVTGSADATMKLWEISSNRLINTFRGHTASVCATRFSRDGKYIISGSTDGTVKLWLLDWELEDRSPADWEEGIRPYLQNFLTLHTPIAASLSPGREPSFIDKKNALNRQGKPAWSDNDFSALLYDLGCAGFGWLSRDDVMKKLIALTL